MPFRDVSPGAMGMAKLAAAPVNAFYQARDQQAQEDRRNTLVNREAEEDAMWDRAVKSGDWPTAFRIDPEATQLYKAHAQQQQMSGLGDIPVTENRIDTAPIQKQFNVDRDFAADQQYRKQQLGLQYAQERRLSQPQASGDDEFARYQAMTPKQRELYDRMKGRPVAGAKSVDLARANNTAWNVYQTGMAGVRRGMEGSVTGPIAGRIPAYTAAQQSAEGAVSAMAPVLKQLFRSAGEGVFTDKDQQLLLDMMPTRKDHPAAREFKLNNIDNIVRAKLGLPPLESEIVDLPPPGAR